MKFRTRITVIVGLPFFLGLAGLVFVAIEFAATQATELYETDFGERLRLIEYDYDEVDAVTAASDEVPALQQELLRGMNRKYGDTADVESRPFIVEFTGRPILLPEATGLDADFFSDAMVRRMVQAGMGSLESEYGGTGYLVVFDTYPGWNWISGYAVADDVRFSSVNRFAVRMLVIGLAALVIVNLAVAVFVGRVVRPLTVASAALRRTAEGSIGHRVDVRGTGEMAEIAGSFNTLSESMSTIVSGIREAADLTLASDEAVSRAVSDTERALAEIRDRVGGVGDGTERLHGLVRSMAGAAERIESAASELSRRIRRQLESVNRSSSAVEDMTGSLEEVAALAVEGEESAGRLTDGVAAGAEEVERTEEAVRRILASIDSISEAATVIGGIAEQTNLLSMNAAIEAAHAGEAGRGFSVVAEEIRKLAEEAGTNSESIARVVREVIDSIRSASRSATGTSELFSEIRRGVETFVSTFQDIANRNRRLSAGADDLIRTVTSLKEESAGVDESSKNMDREASAIASAAVDLSAGAADVAAKVAEIQASVEAGTAHVGSLRLHSDRSTGQSRRLAEEVSRFSLNGESGA